MNRKASSEQSSQATSSWKQKYLAALEQQETQERKQQQLIGLLIKALSRISFVAEGVDQQLDKQLAGLRNMLRDGSPSGADLNTVISALDGQAKRIDIVKGERAKIISSSFKSLASQLKKLKPEKEAKQQLEKIIKNLKARSQSVQEYSSLINDFANVQSSVLSDRNITRVSKPFWHQWQTEAQDLGLDASNEDNNIQDDSDGLADSRNTEEGSPTTEPVIEDSSDENDISNDNIEPHELELPSPDEKEPPFSKLNSFICSILKELLQQIDPPSQAKQNYATVKQQIEKGLNWYELVPLLEDVSIVVLSALDQNQQEFERFLSELNERLLSAYEYISVSKQADGDSKKANVLLNQSMRSEVDLMQQSIEQSSDLDQLKTEVSTRLDKIVAAIDQHQTSEQQREDALAKQLEGLIDQVKDMEAASEHAEKRIEEQRQKALRDMLTQLPNREAYQQRIKLEHERWQRYQRPLSLAVCDIDHFKQVNDNFGHLAGDKVLRIIAKTLKTRLRKTDHIARYGGEEFVILMPETDQSNALLVVEGVRAAIASCPFHFKDKPISITMSFGVTEFSHKDSPEAAFERADKALYQAKDNGRNQCVVAENSEKGGVEDDPKV